MSMSREELWEGGWRSQRVVEGKLINPARLLKSGVIAWEYLTDANIPAAAGIKRMSRTTWKAFVNKHFLDRVAEEEQKTCEYCLRIHETAHARYGTPTGLMAHMAYPVQKYLMNLFEDVRCEYLMQGEFPSLVRHFKLLSLSLAEKVYKDSKYGEAKEGTARKGDVLADG